MDDTFADRNSQEDRLYDQLAACNVCELTGIVSPSGVGAGKSRGQEFWSLLLSFDAWRIGSGEMRTNYLTLRRRVTDEELDEFQKSIRPETIVRVLARIAEDNAIGCPQGQLEEFIGLAPADFDLQRYLIELQKPVTYEDKRFGTLKFDRGLDWWYAAEVSWNGETVELDVRVGEDRDLETALQVAYALWDEQSTWGERVKDYAVEKLLLLKNDSWLDIDEAEVSSDEFKKRMKLVSVSVYADGDFEFWHDDGYLFFGHSIQISGNLSDGLNYANIPG